MRQTETKTSNANAYASFGGENGLPNGTDIEFSGRTKFASSRAQQSTVLTTRNAFQTAKTTTTTQQTNVNNIGKYFSYLPFVFRSTTIDFVVSRLKIGDLHAMHVKLRRLNGLILITMIYRDNMLEQYWDLRNELLYLLATCNYLKSNMHANLVTDHARLADFFRFNIRRLEDELDHAHSKAI